MNEFYIGLMSGTSLDGVDAVLVDFAGGEPKVLAHAHRPFEVGACRRAVGTEHPWLERACTAPRWPPMRWCACGATAIGALLVDSGVAAAQVRAIGAHGQTVRHRPGEFGGTGYTVQLNNPALLAELSGIDVVADLRSRDLAGGRPGRAVGACLPSRSVRARGREASR